MAVTYIGHFLRDMLLLVRDNSFLGTMKSWQHTDIPSSPPKEYKGLTSPVMKHMTLFSQPVLLIQVLNTNLLSLWFGAAAATVTIVMNHASCR